MIVSMKLEASQVMGVPPVIIHFSGIFHDEPSILGTPITSFSDYNSF